MEGTLMPLLFGALMALVCFCIGISKGYSALWSAVAGFFGHMITAAILLLLPDREQGAAEAKWRRDAQAQEIAQLKARVAQLEALLTPPAPPPEKVAQAKAAAGEKPAQSVFPSRTEESVACPVCGKRQRGDRDLCYFCGTPFQYEDE